MDVLGRDRDQLGVRPVHVLADDPRAVVEPGIQHHPRALLEARPRLRRAHSTTPAPSAPRIRGFGTEGSPWRSQRSRWLSDAARSRTSTSPGRRRRVGDVLVAEDLGPAVLVDAHGFHGRSDRNPAPTWYVDRVTQAELQALGEGARHRRRRRRSGRALRRDRAPHPRAPRRAVSSRTCASRWPSPRSRAIPRRSSRRRAPSSPPRSPTTRPAPSRPPAKGRLPRYTWSDRLRGPAREARRARPPRSAATYRVLVDANQHVDREGAARAGVGFYGKNTLLITRRLRLLGRPRHARDRRRDRAERPARPRLRLVPPLHRRVPDRRARRARRRSTRPAASRTGRSRPSRSRRSSASRSELRCTAATSARTSAPGTGGSRSAALGEPLPRGAEPRRLARRLARVARRRSCVSATTASTSRGTTRATCAATRSSRPGTRAIRRLVPAVAALRRGRRRPMLREHAAWALERLSARPGVSGEARAASRQEIWIAWIRLVRGRVGGDRGWTRHARLPGGLPGLRLGRHGGPRRRARLAFLWLARRDLSSARAGSPSSSRARLRHRDRLVVLRDLPVRGRASRPAASSTCAPIEAAVRFGVRGGVVLPLVDAARCSSSLEWWRADRFDDGRVRAAKRHHPVRDPADHGARRRRARPASFGTRAPARRRARPRRSSSATRSAAGPTSWRSSNRCARALSSSLELDGGLPALRARGRGRPSHFDRLALVLADRGQGARWSRTPASGRATRSFRPASRRRSTAASLEDVLAARARQSSAPTCRTIRATGRTRSSSRPACARGSSRRSPSAGGRSG